MMQFVKRMPTVWCVVLVLVLWTIGPVTVAVGDVVRIVNPLAMGSRGDAPDANQVEPRVDKPTVMIRMGVTHFDPLYKQPVPVSGAPVIDAITPGATGYYIVQFDGPIQSAWRTALEQAGVEVFDYVPDFTFIVRMNSDRERAVRSLAHVRWVGIYQPSFRISQSAMSLMYTASGAADAEPVVLRVNVFPGVNLAEVETRIQALGGDVTERSSSQLKSTFKVVIPASNISGLIGIDGIKWIEPAPQWKLHNNVSSNTNVMNVRSARDDHGLYGIGQTVCVADTGLDQGSTSPGSLHDDFEDGSGGSRVLTILDTANDGDVSDSHSHGTHVAGSVLGNGDLSGSDPASDSFPSSSIAGIAPKASLVFQALHHTSGSLITPANLNTLFGDARDEGAQIHTNSWGVGVYGQYTATSEDVDEFMWNNKDFLIHFSAGNDGVDMDGDGVIDQYSIGAPATAKNCLTVGASEGLRPSGAGYDFAWGTGWPDDYSADPVASDHLSDDAGGLAAFSSRGPTLDGRYKPDIVAPGTNILSTRTSVSGSGSGWGIYNDDYMWNGGTSMSCPLAAGASALMREYLMTEAGFAPPSAALIKAALFNSATDILPGQYSTGPSQEIPEAVPNNVEGWGRVNLGNGAFPTAPANILYYDVSPGVVTDGFIDYPITVTATGSPLKVNLVWTDYPGTPGAQGGLVNDLDLQVTAPDTTVYYPDNASQQTAVSRLSYDSDSPIYAQTQYNGYANRFTPTTYPARVDSVSIYPLNTVRGTDMLVVVYDDDGAGGLPGSILFVKSVPYIPTADVTIPVEGVEIASGDFYVALEPGTTGTQGVVRDAADSGGRSYYDNGAGWTQTSAYTWYIRANVRTTNYATSFDRVNNAVGITIPTPAAGTYTVRVAGYNVPQLPQPFALVASGNIQEYARGELQLRAATYSVDEDAGTIDINVDREGGSDGDVAVSYATSNGTATAGSDYTAVSGTLNWANLDSASKTITISIIDDTDGENNETFTVTLTNPTNGATLGTIDTATLTINLNDGGAPGGGGGGGGCFIDTTSLGW